MFNFKIVVLTCFVIGICTSWVSAAFVDKIQRCSIHDSKCLTRLYQYILESTTKNGLPEYGIPPTDPIVVSNLTFSVLNLLDVTVDEAVAKGVKNTDIRKVEVDLTTKNFTMDFSLGMKIKGTYNVTSTPLIQTYLGSAVVHGDGNFRVDVDTHITAAYEFFLRKSDGNIYFDYKYEGMSFNFEFRRMRLFMDDLYIGDQEMSKPISRILNENWRFFTMNFGRPFVEQGMNIFFNLTHKFYDNTPAKNLILEDLSPYLPDFK